MNSIFQEKVMEEYMYHMDLGKSIKIIYNLTLLMDVMHNINGLLIALMELILQGHTSTLKVWWLEMVLPTGMLMLDKKHSSILFGDLTWFQPNSIMNGLSKVARATLEMFYQVIYQEIAQILLIKYKQLLKELTFMIYIENQTM